VRSGGCGFVSNGYGVLRSGCSVILCYEYRVRPGRRVRPLVLCALRAV
jgi:hypothetical protein